MDIGNGLLLWIELFLILWFNVLLRRVDKIERRVKLLVLFFCLVFAV